MATNLMIMKAKIKLPQGEVNTKSFLDADIEALREAVKYAHDLYKPAHENLDDLYDADFLDDEAENESNHKPEKIELPSVRHGQSFWIKGAGEEELLEEIDNAVKARRMCEEEEAKKIEAGKKQEGDS